MEFESNSQLIGFDNERVDYDREQRFALEEAKWKEAKGRVEDPSRLGEGAKQSNSSQVVR